MPSDDDKLKPRAPAGAATRATTSAATPRDGLNAASDARESSLSLPSLSPPQGGGSIRGIDAKFQTNPATGTASLQIPIAASPGRAGFQLGMSISYDSGAGNGPFGVGWELSLPAITRKTDKALPRYLDGYSDVPDADVFILSGAEDLVPERTADGRVHERLEGAYRVRRYRPRVEGAFARIERWTHERSGDIHWRTTTGGNLTSVFGKSKQTRIIDPADRRRVFSWLLEETCDDRGNVVRYEYKREDGAGVGVGGISEANRFDAAGAFCATAQRYLKRVLYCNRRPNDPSEWLFEVVLDYGEHEDAAPTPVESRPWDVRSDPFSTYRAGFEVRTYRLCRRALVFHRFAELGDEPCLVRSTEFSYDPREHLTRLVRVTHAGYERLAGAHAYARATLPPVDLAYTPRQVNDEMRTLKRDALEGIPAGVNRPDAQWVDLNGEGIPGVLLENNRGWYYKANLGGGQLAPPALLRSLPVPAQLRDGYQQLVDIDGAGQLALVRYTPPLAGYFARTPEGGWAPFMEFNAIPNIDWRDPNLRFIDLDGDGSPEALLTEEDAFVWYRSRGKKGFASALFAPKPRDEERGAAVIFSDRTEAILLADMSGDGLIDIVRVRNREVCYWPNLGYGRFGRKVTLARSPRFEAPHLFDPARVRLADIDGSGTSDIIYLGSDGVRLYFNESGNRLSKAIPLSLPIPHTLASVSVVDLLGRGTACLVLSSADPADGSRPLVYVDLMGGTKPHMLDRFANNFGGETTITYASSTSFYLRDKAEGQPWVTRLPFPVQIVARVEQQDHVAQTKFVTRYRYHHGFYDGVEREYRGFAYVEQWDAESFGGAQELVRPPVRTRTWFHTGAWLDRERFERALARGFYAADPHAPSLPHTLLPEGLSIADQREAARALRGRVLRQEIYAEDGAPESAHPYSVSERNYSLRELQRVRGDEHGVFFVHAREQIDRAYERHAGDPRISQELVLDVDDFGNVTRSVSLAYPRRTPREPEQARLWATLSETKFVNHPGEDWFRLGVPIESKTSELTGLPQGHVLSLNEARSLVDTARAIPFETTASDIAAQRLLARAQTTYYRDDLVGPLPFGDVGARALPYETRKQAFTPGLLTAVYEDRIDDAMLAEGGYRFEHGAWWAPSSRPVFDPDAFYQPTESIDPFGNRSRVRYDAYALLTAETEDALGNKVTAGNRDADGASTFDGNDYRVLAASLVTDANLNRRAGAFDRLGLLVRTAVMGKRGAAEGDTLDDPTTRIEYNLHRYLDTGGKQPLFVRSLAREKHGKDNPRWQETYTYIDGSGRTLMRKVQADPGPVPVRAPGGGLVRDPNGAVSTRIEESRWIGTGRTVFDNKGNVVKKYEPFFSDTSEYEDERELAEWGVTPILRYDPIGRLVRTDLPNGTFRKVEFDAWTQASFDENDTVLESAWFHARGAPDPRGPEPRGDPGRRAAWLAAQHAGTPARAYLDPLGRTFLTEENNRDPSGPYRTRVELDVSGNALAVTDARGQAPLRDQRFDMLRRRLSASFADAGTRQIFVDVAGLPLRSWDARGTAQRILYDGSRRATHRFVRRGNAPEVLTSLTLYGERHPEAEARNLRTSVYASFDGAGVRINERNDFKGNVTHTERRLGLHDDAAPDWLPVASSSEFTDIARTAEALLDEESFRSTAEYDALNRAVVRTSPDGSVTRRRFNPTNLLEALDVRVRGAETWTQFLTSIEYNARGQRTRVVHGNGVVSSYEYDLATFQLARIRTKRRDGGSLQDLRYEHDPVGNVVEAKDGVSFGNPSVSADGFYVFDALYRLTRAEGREHPGQQPRSDDDSIGGAHANDLQALRRYEERYVYDAVGNIGRVTHKPLDVSAAAWVRRYEYEGSSNRLARTASGNDSLPSSVESYTYDANGNTTSMAHLAEMEWDYADRLATAQRGGGGVVRFFYGDGGERVRKVYEHSGIVEERIYLGEFELYRRRDAGASRPSFERETLHIVDDRRRVALVETATIDTTRKSSPGPRVRYQLDDHRASSVLEIDAQGAVISYEESTPYGSRALYIRDGRAEVSAKRYRYMGREHDEETGLYYWGLRYYAPWIGRWTSSDPQGLADGPNGYEFVHGNPLTLFDPDGGSWKSFAAGLAVGAATAVAVAAVVAYVVTAPISVPATIAIAAVGAGVTGYTAAQTARQRDILNRPISKDQADFQAGTIVGGLVAAPFSGPASGAAGATASEFSGGALAPAIGPPLSEAISPVVAPAIAVPMVSIPATEAVETGITAMMASGPPGGGSSSSSESNRPNEPTSSEPEPPVCQELPPVSPQSPPPTPAPASAPALPPAKVNLNSNSATSRFGVYEINVNNQLYKVGKADLNRVTQSSRLPTRLHQQVRKLGEIHGTENVEGTVVENLGEVTTSQAKAAEAARIRATYEATGVVPPGNARSFKP